MYTYIENVCSIPVYDGRGLRVLKSGVHYKISVSMAYCMTATDTNVGGGAIMKFPENASLSAELISLAKVTVIYF